MTAEALVPPDVFRVLYVDDDAKHRELTRDVLQQSGPFLVDFAADLAEADQHVDKNKYDAVLVDVDLRNTETSGRQGDDWVRMRYDVLQPSFVAIVTAQKPKVRQGDWLRDHHIPVVEKGPDELEMYDRLAERVQQSPAAARDATQTQELTTMGPANLLLKQTLSLFFDWVDSLPDGDVKDVWFAGRMVSPQDLKQEMLRDSPIGKKIASLFLDHARTALGLSDEVNN